MGTLTLTVKRDDAEAIAYAVTLADNDIARLSVAYAAAYFPNGIEETPAVLNPDGSVLTPVVMRAPTSTEVVTAIASGLANGMLANTLSYERQKAATDAAAGIAPITSTVV